MSDDRLKLEYAAIDAAFATTIKGQFDLLFAALVAMRGHEQSVFEQLCADEYQRCLVGVELARMARDTLRKICNGTD